MDFSGLLGFMELFVVLAFALGWAVLELVALRMDKRRQAHARSEGDEHAPSV
jgi:hypothetical protein